MQEGSTPAGGMNVYRFDMNITADGRKGESRKLKTESRDLKNCVSPAIFLCRIGRRRNRG
jgi:hypothetical protein